MSLHVFVSGCVLTALFRAGWSQTLHARHPHHGYLSPLGSPHNVQLDFEYFSDHLSHRYALTNQSLPINVGSSNFDCWDPDSIEDAFSHAQASCSANKSDCQSELADSSRPNKKASTSALKEYLKMSKLSSFLHRCYNYYPGAGSWWTFKICFGQEIEQFHFPRSTSLLGHTLFFLGRHNASADELYNNGTMVQHYTDGTDGRYSWVKFVCGLGHANFTSVIFEPDGIGFGFIYEAPQFCDWRPNSSSKPSLDRLVAPLEGWCTNYTIPGSWTYEYCHPDSLTQFDMDKSGKIKHYKFLLGGLSTPGNLEYKLLPKYKYDLTFEQLEQYDSGLYDSKLGDPLRYPPVSASFPHLRSPTMPPPSARVNGTIFNNVPMEIEPLPLDSFDFYDSRSAKKKIGSFALVSRLQFGTTCSNVTGAMKQSRIIFYCPVQFLSQPKTILTLVHEVDPCNYAVHISTPLVCAHPVLMPPPPPLPKNIHCTRRRGLSDSARLHSSPTSDYRLVMSSSLTTSILEAVKRLKTELSEFDHLISSDLMKYPFLHPDSIASIVTSRWLLKPSSFSAWTSSGLTARATRALLSVSIGPGLYSSYEDTRKVEKSLPNSPFFELLPLSWKITSGYFASGAVPRYRNVTHGKRVGWPWRLHLVRKEQVPLFRIGDVLEHVTQGYRGVVMGWDFHLKAPPLWFAEVVERLGIRSDEAQRNIRMKPWYLLHVADNNGVVSVYVPETFLKPLRNPADVLSAESNELLYKAGEPYLSLLMLDRKFNRIRILAPESAEPTGLETKYPDDGIVVKDASVDKRATPSSDLALLSKMEDLNRRLESALGMGEEFDNNNEMEDFFNPTDHDIFEL